MIKVRRIFTYDKYQKRNTHTHRVLLNILTGDFRRNATRLNIYFQSALISRNFELKTRITTELDFMNICFFSALFNFSFSYPMNTISNKMYKYWSYATNIYWIHIKRSVEKSNYSQNSDAFSHLIYLLKNFFFFLNICILTGFLTWMKFDYDP